MARKRSRLTSPAPACRPLSSRRPRYCSSRSALYPKKSGVHTAPYARAVSWSGSDQIRKGVAKFFSHPLHVMRRSLQDSPWGRSDMIATLLTPSSFNSAVSRTSFSLIAFTYGQWLQMNMTSKPLDPAHSLQMSRPYRQFLRAKNPAPWCSEITDRSIVCLPFFSRSRTKTAVYQPSRVILPAQESWKICYD